MRIIGFDIGTTTLSAVVTDVKTGNILYAQTMPSSPFYDTALSFERMQDAAWILDAAQNCIVQLCQQFAPIASIGITGQMHGIVYLDADGNPVSPLYTWQDGRAAQSDQTGETTLCRIQRLTGYSLSAGYGLATHTYNTAHNLVPAQAVKLCTIHDALVVRLCENLEPIMHVSDAASFGLYNFSLADFDRTACEALFDLSILPQVCAQSCTVGTFHGIPVSVAIGDNQASILGTMSQDADAVLFNVGTGSQVSVILRDPVSLSCGELRPYVNGTYLACGCSLCGGKALALLERFFASYASLLGHNESQYPIIDHLAEQIPSIQDPVHFSTCFCGTREDPQKRASIENLTDTNFTPAHFVGGVMHGMAQELLAYYASFSTRPPLRLYGSGNGIRKSRALRQIFERALNLPMQIPAHREEAAYGAALFSAASAGLASLEDLQKNIQYESNESSFSL